MIYSPLIEVCNQIRNHSHIHISSGAQVPHLMVREICNRVKEGRLKDIHFHHSYSEGEVIPDDMEGYEIYDDVFFSGAKARKQILGGNADYIPVHLEDTQLLYRSGAVHCDVAIVMVSSPDYHGRVSLGGDCVCSLGAIEVAEVVVAVVNDNVPYSFGDTIIEPDKIDYFIEDNSTLDYSPKRGPSVIDEKIGRYCAELIPDGACLQMGIGSLPDALADNLKNHKNLGCHSEMFSDGIFELIRTGVINGSKKNIDKGCVVSSFILGSADIFKYVDYNQDILFKDIGYTNNPFVISQNDNVVSVNAAIEIDITGQVCADSFGDRIISGTGGQLDFVRGANRSKGGFSIIALPSRSKMGTSRIVPHITVGGGVVTPRADVHYVVTEYGAVNLFGKTLRERAKLLINIAHPSDREHLEKRAFERFGKRY